MIAVNQLIIEVTRRCNMACGHCLRGTAQNLDINNEIIEAIVDNTDAPCSVTFTGGEPTLNLDAIEHYFEYAAAKNKLPAAFYCVTNGTGDQLRLATILLKYYPFMDEKDMCGVALSVDEFHETPDPEHALIKGLAFYDDAKETQYSAAMIIGEGNGQKFTGARPLSVPDDFWMEDAYDDTVAVDELYVSANGKLYQVADASYKRIDREAKYNIQDITAFADHLKTIAEE